MSDQPRTEAGNQAALPYVQQLERQDLEREQARLVRRLQVLIENLDELGEREVSLTVELEQTKVDLTAVDEQLLRLQPQQP